MTDNNKNENSLARISSIGLMRVGNSIDVTRKLISQGGVIEINYSKIYIIPFKKEDGYYLYDKRTNSSGKGPYKSISRNREFIICLDYNKKFWVLKNDQILFQFSDFAANVFTLFPPEFAPPFQIIENKYIVIFYYRAIYGRKYITGYQIEIECVFDFDGNKTEHPLTEKDLEVIIANESNDDLKIPDTLWRINKTILYFKNKIILNSGDIEEINVSKFHYGYALVKEIADYDPEFGEMSREIGYVDVYGNYYWQ